MAWSRAARSAGFRRDYHRVKYEPDSYPDAPAGARRLAAWTRTKAFSSMSSAPRGEYLDSFFLPLPKGVNLHALGLHPLTITGRTMLVLEAFEDGRLEVVKYEILDPGERAIPGDRSVPSSERQ